MKKGLVNVIILALVLVNLVLSVVLVFTFVPSIKKTGKLVDKICTIVDLDTDGKGDEKQEVAIEDLEYVTFTFADGATDQVFNLKQEAGTSSVYHIKLGISLAINTKHEDYSSKSASLNSAMAYIAGKIGDVMLEYTSTEANTNKKEIETRVLNLMRELTNSDFIYGVSFPQFIISK